MSDDINIDDLFEHRSGGPGRGWYQGMGDDERQLIDAIAERALESGAMPNIHAVRRKVKELFDDPISTNPINKHFRMVLETGKVDPR